MSASTHLLLYPFPTAGHIIPMLDLAHALLLLRRRNQLITITLLVTPSNLPLLGPLLSLFPSTFHHLLLPFHLPSVAHQHLTSKITSLRILDSHIVNWFNSHPSPPCAIVSDFFLGWTQSLALTLGIKRIVFSLSGAFALSIANSLWQRPLHNNSDSLTSADDSIVDFPDLPGSPTFRWWQTSQLYRSAAVDCDNQDWVYFRASWLQNLQSWGTIVNTFAALESKYIDHLKSADRRVWAVGPLLPDDLQAPDRGGTSTLPSDEIKTWLDLKSADDSVVFVCFGSRCALSKKQLQVLTAALDRSGVSFILSVRSFDGSHSNQVAMDDPGEVPEGYENRVAGRGLVIRGWAPQVAILNHRAVGAFVTHCGWNSVLEGLSAGVVMLTWPMGWGSDQFTNAKLLVEEAGVGIRVGESTRVVPEVDELAAVLVQSVDPTRVERKRALEFRSAAKAAVRGGSSEMDLEDLLSQLERTL